MAKNIHWSHQIVFLYSDSIWKRWNEYRTHSNKSHANVRAQYMLLLEHLSVVLIGIIRETHMQQQNHFATLCHRMCVIKIGAYMTIWNIEYWHKQIHRRKSHFYWKYVMCKVWACAHFQNAETTLNTFNNNKFSGSFHSRHVVDSFLVVACASFCYTVLRQFLCYC